MVSKITHTIIWDGQAHVLCSSYDSRRWYFINVHVSDNRLDVMLVIQSLNIFLTTISDIDYLVLYKD